MKIPLSYQRTEYDCGPTSMLNAISYLFPREEIPPDLFRQIVMYTLDAYSPKGEAHKHGTSQMAMSFLAGWLNQYAAATRLPIGCEYMENKQVKITQNNKIIECLQQGGVVVLRVYFEGWHYVTLTGLDGESVLLFDPYHRTQPFPQKGIEIIDNQPYLANRKVSFDALNQKHHDYYAMGEISGRAAVLLFNENTRKTPEKTIEYFL